MLGFEVILYAVTQIELKEMVRKRVFIVMILNLYFIIYMNSLVSFLSSIYSFLAMHSLLVTFILDFVMFFPFFNSPLFTKVTLSPSLPLRTLKSIFIATCKVTSLPRVLAGRRNHKNPEIYFCFNKTIGWGRC